MIIVVGSPRAQEPLRPSSQMAGPRGMLEDAVQGHPGGDSAARAHHVRHQGPHPSGEDFAEVFSKIGPRCGGGRRVPG